MMPRPFWIAFAVALTAANMYLGHQVGSVRREAAEERELRNMQVTQFQRALAEAMAPVRVSVYDGPPPPGSPTDNRPVGIRRAGPGEAFNPWEGVPYALPPICAGPDRPKIREALNRLQDEDIDRLASEAWVERNYPKRLQIRRGQPQTDAQALP